MDLVVTKGKNGDEFVKCPKTGEQTNVVICMKCDFLRICLSDKVKCVWSIERENNAKKYKKNAYLPETYTICGN